MKENTGAVNAQVPVDVATFLLNEKRVDLQSIETRHRVNIMLIPNVHLETPNYAITRMRHDDLNKTEPLPASYNLVTLPTEEEQKAQPGSSEPAAPRPEAVVKGITPQQPAPIPVARETKAEQQPQLGAAAAGEASIISKIFGWFKRPAAAATPPAESAARPPLPERGQHRGRHERGDRDGGRRDRQPERGQQGGQRQNHQRNRDQQRDGGRHRHEQDRNDQLRQDSNRRHEQHSQDQDLGPRQQPAQQQQPQRGPAQDQPPPREHGEQREGRGRRRRRGGRDRNEQRQGEGGGDPSARGRQPESAQREPFRPASETPAPAAGLAAVAPAQFEPVAASTMTEETRPAGSSYQEPHFERPAFEHEQVREYPQSTATPRVTVPAGAGYAPATPVKIEWPSDLQQVESDPEKIRSVQQEAVEEAPAPRPRRVRQPSQPVSEEPLVQIETDRLP